MCPACYINAILFSIFGVSAASIANNPWVITLSIILTIFALYWLYKGWKKHTPRTFMKNLRMTVILVAVFAAGYVTASYTTNGYFMNMFEEKHKH
tara:strand:+ start:366 stop:650 length:285 start_codon:yes stop_codon:yes gene_type:complete